MKTSLIVDGGDTVEAVVVVIGATTEVRITVDIVVAAIIITTVVEETMAVDINRVRIVITAVEEVVGIAMVPVPEAVVDRDMPVVIMDEMLNGLARTVSWYPVHSII